MSDDRTSEIAAAGGIVTALAELPGGTLLDEKALAGAFGVSTRTLRRMVGRYELPPGVKFGGRKVWLAGKVLAYMEERADRLAVKAAKEAEKILRIS